MSNNYYLKFTRIVLLIFIINLYTGYSAITHGANIDKLSGSSSIVMIDKREDLSETPNELITVNDKSYLILKNLCLFYKIGFTYDPLTKGVTLKKDNKMITLRPDKTEFKIGKKLIKFETPPIIVNWKMVVPPREMASVLEELLEYPVAWRPSRNTFTVNDQEGVSFWEDNPEKLTKSIKHNIRVITPGDVLSISVWQKGSFELEELTRERAVEDDGTIKFPFVGRIVVEDLTIKQLESRLMSRLKGYIKNPEVTVRIQGATNDTYTVQIFGEVRNPGPYEFTSRATLMEAVNKAGGFTNRAKMAKVRVTRFIHHSPYKTDVVNCKLILHQGQRQYDIPIEDKDIIFVPKSVGFWNSVGDGISKMSPMLSVTALMLGIIISAKSL